MVVRSGQFLLPDIYNLETHPSEMGRDTAV